MSECKDRLYLNKTMYPGIIFPDRADASRRRLGGRGREQPRVGTSATGHGLHASAQETGSKGHSADKAWKMAPSAVRVECIASAACTRVSTRPNIVFGAKCSHG